jgi:hypothetical protein
LRVEPKAISSTEIQPLQSLDPPGTKQRYGMPSIAHNTPRLGNAEFWRHFEGDRILATADIILDKVEGTMGLFADLDLGSGHPALGEPAATETRHVDADLAGDEARLKWG